MECNLFIACLIIGFFLGRLGSHVYDGRFILGENQEDDVLELPLNNKQLRHYRYIVLKVVKKKKSEK